MRDCPVVVCTRLRTSGSGSKISSRCNFSMCSDLNWFLSCHVCVQAAKVTPEECDRREDSANHIETSGWFASKHVQPSYCCFIAFQLSKFCCSTLICSSNAFSLSCSALWFRSLGQASYQSSQFVWCQRQFCFASHWCMRQFCPICCSLLAITSKRTRASSSSWPMTVKSIMDQTKNVNHLGEKMQVSTDNLKQHQFEIIFVSMCQFNNWLNNLFLLFPEE